MRHDGRKNDEIRKVNIIRQYQRGIPGSVLIESGNTRVIVTARVQEGAPPFREEGLGWLTAEYSMIPSASPQRVKRERSKVNSRNIEIQRLIGRALRSVIDFEILGERTILIDADVIQADGGTRTASITGAYVAIVDALMPYVEEGTFPSMPIKHQIAAISVGKVNGEIMVDLDYEEDSVAEVDMNVVMISNGGFIEIQGTGEHSSFSEEELNLMIKYAKKGIEELWAKQREVLGYVD